MFGVRALLESRPDFVAVKIDLRNAYNEVKRDKVLQALVASPSLRGLAPLFYATHADQLRIHLSTMGMPEADEAEVIGVRRILKAICPVTDCDKGTRGHRSTVLARGWGVTVADRTRFKNS